MIKMRNVSIIIFAALLFANVSMIAKEPSKTNKQRTIVLWGHVKNSFTKVGIPGTFISLMRSDSTVIDTMHVCWNGNDAEHKDTWYRFVIPATPQKFIIKAQHPDYNDCYVDENIKYVARNTYFDAPWHFMKRKEQSNDYGMTLKEVVVKATKVKLLYRGDTLIYNADAFNVPQGSMLNELIRQLPGVKLKDNGEITVNGRKLDYITLNGENFFKGKNKVILDNMPYYTVKNIKVYNKTTEKSQYLGSDVEKKDYVMDVQLKREYSRGYIANVEGGLGTENRYLSRLFGLRYTDHSRLSLFGNMNNVNMTKRPGDNGEWNPSNFPIGYTSIKTAGADLLIDDKEKLYKESASAQLSWNDNDQQSRTTTTTYLTSGNSYSLQRISSRQKNLNLNFDNELTFNKPFRINWKSNLNYSTWNTNNMSNSATFNNDPSAFGNTMDILDSMFRKTLNTSLKSISVNRTDNGYLGNCNAFSLSQSITANKRLPWGDDLELHYDLYYNHSMIHHYNLMQTDYFKTSSTDYRNVITDNPNRSYHYNARVEYTIHKLNNWNYIAYVMYDQSWQDKDSPQYRLSRLRGWGAGSLYTLGSRPSTADSLLRCLDIQNSEKSNYMDKNSRGAFRIYYFKEFEGGRIWFNIHLPIYYREENEHYVRNTTDTCFTLRNCFFQPNINLEWYFHHWNRMINFSYTTNNETPNVQNLVSVRNDSNPLTVYWGNPNLKNILTHDFNIAFRNNVPKYQQSLNLSASAEIIKNKVVNGYTYDPSTGVYTYVPDNINGNWNVSSNANFNRAIDEKKRWTMEVSLANNYDHAAYLAAEEGLTQSRRCTINSNQLSSSLGLKYQLNALTIGINEGNIMLHSTGSLSTFRTVNMHSLSCGTTIEYTLPWKIQLATDFNIYHLKGMNDAALNKNYYLWNASLSRSFAQGHIICELDCFDILSDVSQVSSSTDSRGFSSTWSNGLTNYVMLHLSYKINVMPKKK
jgi:hypothetical protein